MGFSKEIGGGGLKEERIRFKQVGRKFQKYNECPTAGMSSDWSEQVNRLEDGESEESRNKAESNKCSKPSEQFLHLTCTLESLGELLKILTTGPQSSNSDLIGVQPKH